MRRTFVLQIFATIIGLVTIGYLLLSWVVKLRTGKGK